MPSRTPRHPTRARAVTSGGVELWPTRDTPRPRRAPSAPDVPRRRGGRDEDAEDALIDAQLGEQDGR